MSFITDTQIEATKQLSAFSACSKEEQLILQVLAVIDKTISQTDLKLILKKLCNSELKHFKGLKIDKLFVPASRKTEKKKSAFTDTKGLANI